MIVIVESGSSKSDWIFLSPQGMEEKRYHLMGFNPLFHSTEFMVDEILRHPLLLKSAKEIKHIFFYGAGCSSPEKNAVVSQALSTLYPQAAITVDHDLAAAAYATYSGVPGISCILGTGSNCVYFDGKNMTEFTPSLGYILGDEGSGSYFGKELLRACLYGTAPRAVSDLFFEEFGMGKEEIINKIYREANANVFLAGFGPFIFKVRGEAFIKNMLEQGFRLFMQAHVCRVEGYLQLPVHFAGSVAFSFREELKSAADSLGLNLGKVVKAPLDELVRYHAANIAV